MCLPCSRLNDLGNGCALRPLEEGNDKRLFGAGAEGDELRRCSCSGSVRGFRFWDCSRCDGAYRGWHDPNREQPNVGCNQRCAVPITGFAPEWLAAAQVCVDLLQPAVGGHAGDDHLGGRTMKPLGQWQGDVIRAPGSGGKDQALGLGQWGHRGFLLCKVMYDQGRGQSCSPMVAATAKCCTQPFRYANTSMAAGALWISASTSEERPIRVIRRAPDRINEFGAGRFVSDTMMVDVRVSDLPDPRPGDLIVIGTDSFTIQGEPVRDRERLIWTVDLRPA